MKIVKLMRVTLAHTQIHPSTHSSIENSTIASTNSKSIMKKINREKKRIRERRAIKRMRRTVCAENILINLCNVSWQIYSQVKYDAILTRHISFHFICCCFFPHLFIVLVERWHTFPGRQTTKYREGKN